MILSFPIHSQSVVLTSSEAMQYQQKTWRHLRHIIWAQPASLSMGTRHIGHHLIFSEVRGSWLPAVWGRQEWPGSQGRRQAGQNWREQEGQVAGWEEWEEWEVPGHR